MDKLAWHYLLKKHPTVWSTKLFLQWCSAIVPPLLLLMKVSFLGQVDHGKKSFQWISSLLELSFLTEFMKLGAILQFSVTYIMEGWVIYKNNDCPFISLLIKHMAATCIYLFLPDVAHPKSKMPHCQNHW